MAKSIEFEIKIKGGDGGVLRTLTVEAANADEAIGRIVESASNASDSIRRMAEAGMAFTPLNRAISEINGMVQSLAAPFNSFEDAMAKVNTMAGRNADGLKDLTDQIQDVSEVVPLAREALAEGLYQTISAGVPEAQWLDYLNTSARSAVGGCADLGGVVKVTSGIIKAYGADWADAGAIQDKIQQTAKLGVTSFEELSQALPRVTGNAATLGVQIDELMAVFATATNVTGNTAEVSTQLAAVLNSLVKPSTEATKAAQAMGISFDAASVRAAGGLQNFLLGIDAAVKEYAASTGTLSETIYGQLFGSAEALRLLGSLTGEQRQTFATNIEAMADSAGAMDQAFGQMASTGSSNAAVLRNQIDGLLGWAGAAASTAAPTMELVANVGGAMTTMAQLSATIQTLAGSTAALRVRTLAVAAAHRVAAVTAAAWRGAQALLTATTIFLTSNLARQRVTAVAMSVASKAAAAAAAIWQGAQIALNAVLSANPIGIVIMAVAALVAAIIYAYNNFEGFRAVCDKVWTAVKNIASAIWDYLAKAFETCSKAVQTAWRWVQEFFGLDSGSIEAEAAAVEASTSAIEDNSDALARAARETLTVKQATDWQVMSYEQLGKAIEAQKVKVAQLAGTKAASAASEAALLKQMEARYKALGKTYGLTDAGKEYDGKSLISRASTYKELGNNIQYYQNKLETTKPSETAEIERLSRLIMEAKRAQESIERLQAAASRPTEFSSLSDFDKELQYLAEARNQAQGSDAIAAIDTRISELTRQRAAVVAAAFRVLPVEDIDTFEELSQQLSHYETALQTATGPVREEIQGHINDLNKLKESWEATLSSVGMDVSPESLNTLAEVEKALSHYEDRRKKASADEVEGISATIVALNRQADKLRQLADLGEIKAESGRLAGLGNQELKLQLRLLGADEVESTIKALRAMLANPALNDSDRKGLEALMTQWQSYSNTLKRTTTINDMVTGSLGGMSDMLGSIASMTNEDTARMINWGAKTVDACSKAFAAIMAVAAGKAASSVADLPVVGWVMAGAAIASVLAAFASIPKFAVGGIAYGPTLGLFGEYAGASSNPEVVAPLDRLRSLITPAGDSGGDYKTIRVEIPGRKLVALLAKEKAFNDHR
ncbi:MAG: phage tail tape measure protein [Pseudoflavonifractor sp.]|nr:phage tail tape measure protein [Pseudoflavonifractor sp.]